MLRRGKHLTPTLALPRRGGRDSQEGTPPNWAGVLRTAIGPASLAGYLAVRSTRAQHLGCQPAVA